MKGTKEMSTLSMTRRWTAVVATLAVGTVMALSGCAASSSGSSSGDLSIGYLPKMLGNPYFDEAGLGAKEATKALGGAYTQVGPQVGAADAQTPSSTRWRSRASRASSSLRATRARSARHCRLRVPPERRS